MFNKTWIRFCGSYVRFQVTGILEDDLNIYFSEKRFVWRVPGWKPFSRLLWGTSTSVMLRRLNIILYVVHLCETYIYIYSTYLHLQQKSWQIRDFPLKVAPPRLSAHGPISHPLPVVASSSITAGCKSTEARWPHNTPVGSYTPWKLTACSPENPWLVSDVFYTEILSPLFRGDIRYVRFPVWY